MFILKSKKTGRYYKGNGIFTTDINEALVYPVIKHGTTSLEKIEVDVKIVEEYLIVINDYIFLMPDGNWTPDKAKACRFERDDAQAKAEILANELDQVIGVINVRD
jgi:hypothetical protein